MFPKLSLMQWILFVILMLFFGFTVFAFTRDFYLRHPPARGLEATAAHGLPSGQDEALGQRMRAALGTGGADVEVDLGSTDALALGEAADRLFAARRFEEAIAVYERVLALQPEDAETRNDLGLALHYTGRGAEAMAMLQQGAESAPAFQRIWLSLGFVALQNGDAELAEQALQRAVAIDASTDVAAEATRLLGLMD
jgi:tetratricopeptide (TPR) repeat protein